jgi:hypothetical protein
MAALFSRLEHINRNSPLVTASNGGRSPSSGFPNCQTPQQLLLSREYSLQTESLLVIQEGGIFTN